MFKHSITVPRNYKIAAKIVQKVTEEGGSFKTLLYDDKLKHFRIDVLYALINETIKHAVDIERLFESTGILVNEPRLNPWLAKVLTAELLYGKKTLPGESKPVQTILSYKDQFQKLIPEVQDDAKPKVRKPRYVRINTNLLTTSDAIRAFQDEGFKFIRCTSGSYNDYLQQVQRLTEDDFTQDYHVKTIFIFSPRIKMHDHELYKESKIVLQDKATALAVHLLAPPPGSVVLDMCAAPGMKTTQLAAYMRNEGKIYAVERDDKRYQTLCEFVEATGSKCVKTLHKDSLQIRRGDMDDVEYILLDPSCSGSGMDLSVHNYVEESRMANLTSLQEKFLKHAMNSFPNAKRIVYSTCSIFPEENERVVTNIVKASRAKWRVKDVSELLKGQWNNFGSGMYGSMGTRCLYAKTDSDFTTGFFLAVLDRDLRDTENQQDENKVANDQDKIYKKVKDKTNNNNHVYENCEKFDTNDNDQEKQQTKKRHRVSESHSTEYVTNPKGLSEGMNGENHVPKSKKKKRNKDNENSIHYVDSQKETNSGAINEKNNQCDDSPDLKKKKQKSRIKDEGVERIIDTFMDTTADQADENSIKTTKNNGDSSLTQDISEDFKTHTKKKKKKRKYFEEPESSKTQTFEYNNDETKISNDRKKKHKEREHENSSVTGPDKDISTVVEYRNTTHEIEIPNKKQKKCKESVDDLQEAVNLPVIDISTDIENSQSSEKSKIFKNNVDIEIPKKKKKKSKNHENEPKEVENINDSIIESICEKERSKKTKKKRRDRESESLEVVEQEKTSKKSKKQKNAAH